MDNYQLPDKLRDSHIAATELYHLIRSIRTAMDVAERAALMGSAALAELPAVCKREAVKAQVLAARMLIVVQETQWPTAAELADLDPAALAALGPDLGAGDTDLH